MWQHTGMQVTTRVNKDRFKFEQFSGRQLYYREPDLVKIRVPGSENRTVISPDGGFFIEFKTNTRSNLTTAAGWRKCFGN